jgi:hypothetical protein
MGKQIINVSYSPPGDCVRLIQKTRGIYWKFDGPDIFSKAYDEFMESLIKQSESLSPKAKVRFDEIRATMDISRIEPDSQGRRWILQLY